MNSSQRISLNAAATYTHSILAVALALFSSRWILAALGASDFGLYSVVCSLILFVTFVNSPLSASVSRFYAFHIGKNDSSEIGRWFNAALGIHLCSASALVIIGWPLGEYVISTVLTIPTERISTCILVFRFSLISAFVSISAVPFLALFTAKQRIVDLAICNILHSVMTFALACFLLRTPGDRLLILGIGMVAILVSIQCLQVIYAITIFSECRIRLAEWLNRGKCKEILSFASWSMVGGFGGLLRNQGSAILLNLHFGPTVNAAFGIANQVSAQSDKLAAALIGAFSPEIISSEGRGNRDRMLSLSQRASKFGAILVILFSIPLVIEIDFVLKLWLTNPPPYSRNLCVLILSSFALSRLSSGAQSAFHAIGRVVQYETLSGICLLSTLPLAWIFLKFGMSPSAVGVAFLITAAAFSFGRAMLTCSIFGITIKSWALSVVWPCLIVVTFSTLTALIPRLLFDDSLMRLLSVVLISISTSIITICLFVLDKTEQVFLKQMLYRFRCRNIITPNLS